MSGKITFPSRDAKGRIITALGNLGDGKSKITHAFFLPDAQYELFGGIDYNSRAFSNIDSLKLVYFP